MNLKELKDSSKGEIERDEWPAAYLEARGFVEKLTDADVLKPLMCNGVDVSLFTVTEFKKQIKYGEQHQKILRKRAEELSFYPDTMTDEERDATFKCLSYKELKPFYKFHALTEKNKRLQEKLSLDEKINVRDYVYITYRLSEFGPAFEYNIKYEGIVIFTECYFDIMRKHGEKVYEKPYYFFAEEHMKRVLKAYAGYFSRIKQIELEGWNRED